MRVLVTGARGFLGGYIAQQFAERGDQVRALIRQDAPNLAQLGVECVRGDIRDPAAVAAACAQCDVVVHAAAVASLWGPWRYFYDANVRGTEHVIAGCLSRNVPRLVFTSSPSVTFQGCDQAGINESVPYPQRWLAHYPHTKAIAEQKVLAANGQHGLLTCALRPHLIWGPGDQHLIPRLLERAKRGQLRQVGPGKNLIDAVFVENAASAHLLAADRLTPASPVCGQPYFITNGEPVNCWQWINEILALANLPPIRRKVPLALAYAAGAALETFWTLTGRSDEPRMTRFLAAQLGTSHYFDIAAARRDLGFSPEVSMAAGMKKLAAWLNRS